MMNSKVSKPIADFTVHHFFLKKYMKQGTSPLFRACGVVGCVFTIRLLVGGPLGASSPPCPPSFSFPSPFSVSSLNYDLVEEAEALVARRSSVWPPLVSPLGPPLPPSPSSSPPFSFFLPRFLIFVSVWAGMVWYVIVYLILPASQNGILFRFGEPWLGHSNQPS